MFAPQTRAAGLLLLAHLLPVHSLELGSRDDILKTSKSLAADLIKFYHGNETGQVPGLLPQRTAKSKDDDLTYYFYQSGAFMSTYIDYWQLTGDETYNDLVMQGILHQVGQNEDFIPANQTLNAANDDQSIWAMAALTAAEYGFPDPPKDEPQWLDLAESVFESQRLRWDIEVEKKTCDGGLRWQIAFSNNGYDWKSAEANTFFFALSSRLARQTGNKTYVEYAEKVWDWLYDIELIDHDTFAVYDGSSVKSNCTQISKVQRSGAASSLALGAAYMYNQTDGSSTWKSRVQNLTSSFVDTFFQKDGSFAEASCPSDNKCARDLLTFKALSQRWLAVTSQIAPFTAEPILKALRKSAEESDADKDGDDALEQTMGELAVVSNLLISDAHAAVSWVDEKAKAGGSGSGNDSDSGSAGSSSDDKDDDSSATRLTGVNVVLALFAWALYFM
ncbi:Mannan endo-1,6-alpha-mannosidase [Fusarium keratoplasticum]|uniref:Mannan endo-1,6-alpha-mannosidase n=1 Tax=Fusarium keratoplasticum TaxID=1328300 RepID=A0ACC0QJB1_9HYPO|nr:Mannan endo-1,6-alpha-mannosidase [Fusarium keratoplasticum]KAI8652814.1 Mannan endo-1,6-alpha-mannosidase [Fusarium keratoplasticum]